ncbi:MAG: alpha/beta hydrolase family protein, partial [Phycisphaerales bacterium]
MKLFTRISILIIALTTTLATASTSPDPIADNWHADLTIPTGKLSLIFTITQADDGSLTATMESPDQAPGQQIPISEITMTDDHLSISMAIIGAGIEADWDDEQQQWIGTFSQGVELPIIIKRGLPDTKPIIEGLDGNWKATITRNGVDLRLILHIHTTDRGTIANVDSPDTMAMNIPLTDLTKDGDQIGYTMPIVDGVLTGTLTDPNTIVGLWVMPGQDDITITYTRSAESDTPVVRNRPQVPTEPLGYRAEEVTYDNPQAQGVTLAGTLTIPQGQGPFPAAILI